MRGIIITSLLLIISTTNLNAQDWESFTEHERKLYLLGWHGATEASLVKMWRYLISHKGSTGRCPSHLIGTVSDIADSLSTYHFRPADIDSLIHLTDKFLLFNELSLDDAVEVVIGKWANRYEHEEGVGTIILWSELEIAEKIIYVDGWRDGSFLGWGEILEIGSHFALENTKFQRAMKELHISGYEEDCLVVVMEGVADLWDILYMLYPDISEYYNKRYVLISHIDESMRNGQDDEQPISDRTTILSIAESIKIWNSKSEE